MATPILAATPPATVTGDDGPVRVLFVGGHLQPKGGLDLLEAARPLLEAGAIELDLVTTDPVPDQKGVRGHRLRSQDPALIEL